MTKLSSVRVRMQSENLDAIIITNLKNIYYLSAFWGTAGTILVTQKAQYLLTDSRYSIAAREAAVDFEIVETREAFVEIAKLLKKEDVSQVGFEDGVTYAEFQTMQHQLAGLTLHATTSFIETQRQIKSPSEIATIKKACAISDQAFNDLLKFVEPGKTEIEIANFLDFKMRDLGASGISFDTIVASGKRSALPHGRATHKPIEFGDTVTVDFGCYYDHYASDMTRTFFVGEVSPKMQEIYHVVQQAQQAVTNISAPGLTYADYDRAARDMIETAGYGEAFSHGIGHGLGLDVHEIPYFSKTSQECLAEHMVITNEPGIYLENIGGVRIEDDLHITSQGVEVLTLAPKELIVL
ncbi:MAG: Xaa-Pro peptidase family protein [Lactococcus chungangensis]|uniref:Xaa-Pro aminopeptidase n=1 Tax=Pseudolactococcus chungangensis CAU 28 = DSM 22330 TaxID=1122154 RepID=A0A1K2H6A8_9LACT|nr:Xaa-Pro peptidase family protein [Lactococcus chungangensis]NCB81605.1 aminopeptidase P family protein [Bacilli bacterium]SFZ71865.1 Xaa-Pro aminopeptidase [Lactococcus chungangensis CAU 28 = DSM 22330]